MDKAVTCLKKFNKPSGLLGINALEASFIGQIKPSFLYNSFKLVSDSHLQDGPHILIGVRTGQRQLVTCTKCLLRRVVFNVCNIRLGLKTHGISGERICPNR